MSTPCWFALIVKPRHEKSTAAGLRAKGFNEFLPLYTARRRWSDRIQAVELPLFPGYIFCQFDADRRIEALRTAGVTGSVGFGSGPEPIPEEQITTIRKVLELGYPVIPCPYLRIGNSISIADGPLAGLSGILLREKSHHRLVVSVELLQRSVVVDIGRDSITAAFDTANADMPVAGASARFDTTPFLRHEPGARCLPACERMSEKGLSGLTGSSRAYNRET